MRQVYRVDKAYFHAFYSLTFFNEQLREDLGGVEYTPTILVVLFQEDRKRIAKIEGTDKIRGAIRSGAAEALISAFIEQRVKLRMADKLAEQMAMRLALGLAVAGAAGAAAARRSREERLKEEFEKEQEREMTQAQRRTRQLRDSSDSEVCSHTMYPPIILV